MADSSFELRVKILEGVCPRLGKTEAVALVGILFEYRLVVSMKFMRGAQPHSKAFDLDPLEPQAAADLLGDLYGVDPDALFLRFQREWVDVKGSPTVGRFIQAIEAHEYVERLEPLAGPP